MQARKKSKRLSPGLVGRPYEPDDAPTPEPSSEPTQVEAEARKQAKESRAMEKFRGEDADSVPKDADPLLYAAPRPPIQNLKSPAHPVIPSANPDAPYGFDENDRPIGMPVGKPYVRPVQTGTIERPSGPCRCGKLLCRHCHPEFIAQTAVLQVIPQPSGLDALAMDALRASFGRPAKLVEPDKFIFFPEALGITRGQLVEMTEMTVAYEPRAVKKRVLKNRAVIEKQIVEVEALNARVVELKKTIKEAEEIIHGLMKRVMKLRRDQDNILDKSTRERFKREERRKISDATQELQTVRCSIRALPGLDELKARLTNWGKSNDDFEWVSVTTVGPVPFEEKFTLTPQLQRDGQTIQSYVTFVKKAFDLWSTSWRYRGWSAVDDWRYLENEIVRQAIAWKLLRPTRAAIEKYPELTGSWTEEDYAGDDSENALILKSGGASIGASIYNFGRNASGSIRLSGTFDNTVKHAHGKGESQPFSESESWLSGMDSGDVDEEIS
jgi:hypothetical protein